MPQTVTLEDYAYKMERLILADPDPWTEMPFFSSDISNAPTDIADRRALRNEFAAELHRLQPDWTIFFLEDAPQMAQSPMARTTDDADRWKWLHIRKRSDEN